MDFILIAFFLSIAIFTRIKTVNDLEDYLSVNNTNSLRGIMSIAVVLHHLCENLSYGYLIKLINHMGYLLVAVFLFLSGYGLMVQLSRKGKDYLKTMWLNRILYFLIIFIFDTMLYIFFRCLNGESCTINRIMTSFLNGHLLAGSSWYLIVQIYLYIIFWLSFSYLEKVNNSIMCVFISIIFLDIIFVTIKYPTFWCFSNLAFVVGIIWANYKNVIKNILNQYYWPCLLGVFICFFLFSMAPSVVSGKYSYLIFRIISSPIFAIFIIIILKKIYFTGKLWTTVNIVSLEIFLLHALIYSILRSKFININNNVVWSLLTLLFSIIISIPAHVFNLKIKHIINYHIKS